jgi:hypothetical protein
MAYVSCQGACCPGNALTFRSPLRIIGLMQDKNGLFYYPFPANRRVRTYVREMEGEIHFRLCNDDDPELWDAHGWIPHSAIAQAAAIYRGGRFDPRQAYDLTLARLLLDETRLEDRSSP